MTLPAEQLAVEKERGSAKQPATGNLQPATCRRADPAQHGGRLGVGDFDMRGLVSLDEVADEVSYCARVRIGPMRLPLALRSALQAGPSARRSRSTGRFIASSFGTQFSSIQEIGL